ncbi:MAG: alkaline phosphatase family protein [Candidatus Krumholzibacteria bacterium]|nr:alkaline phosphatase family protein [Candidatus Krumholzibacteria bacterium]
MTARVAARRFLLLWLFMAVAGSSPSRGAAPYVIHVSVDGLRGDAIAMIGPRTLPHLYRLRIEGAFTDNARNDFDITVTLPNHACELTSRPVLGPEGHGVSFNSDDGRTLGAIHGSYVAGVFDVAHDHGLATGMYASKSKFALFERSWNATNGAPDTTGIDDGRDKIDVYVYQGNTEALLDSFVARMVVAPHRYAFIHIADPDGAGHSYGWESAYYLDSIRKVDGLIGRILDLIDGDARLVNDTYLVVTADHGGHGTDHENAADPLNYTIPLYAWGPGIPAGADLYWLNPSTRANPGNGRPSYAVSPPPIRNSESANLSLDLLGLPSVPGSVLDAAQDCDAVFPGGAGALPAVAITNPLSGTSLEYPASVVIEATADPRSGAIVRVEFFADGVPLGADSTSPYAYAWTEIPLGSYRLTARAVRDDGIAAMASVDMEIASAAAGSDGHSLLRAPRLYPNPFDRLSTIQFSLPETDTIEVDAASYAPGVYFLQLRSNPAVRTAKFTIVR